MADETAISWTEHTWNPWRGCQKISPGCGHCYMFTAQHRRQKQTGKIALWEPSIVQRTTTWREPLKWQREAEAAGLVEMVFTCSWSDFFIGDDEAVCPPGTGSPDQGWREEAWRVIKACSNLHWQILTKRPQNILARLPSDWGNGYPNVWLGVSVENRRFLSRVDQLRAVPARVRFISAEPLLEDIAGELNLEGIHQVIVGGESGPGFRPMDHAWAWRLLEKCRAAGVAFFFKQSAAIRTEMGTRLGGREYKEYPLDLKIEARA